MKKANLIILVLGILVYGTQGQVIFERNVLYSGFSSPAGLTGADVDLDGRTDVVAASGTNGLYLIKNLGDGGWQTTPVDATLGPCLYSAVADIDQDGLPDIISGGWDTNQVVWYKNPGVSGTWVKNVVQSGFIQPHEFYVTDVDLDGDQDILCAGAGINQIAWWANLDGAGGTWQRQVIGDQFAGARSVSAADFDHDGDLDVCGAALNSHQVTVWANNGGNPVGWTRYDLSDSFRGSHRVQAVDMDQDGWEDILGTAYSINTIAWWRNPGTINGTWEMVVVDNSLTGAVIGLAADLDLDGDFDIIGTGQPGNVASWYENTGKDPGRWKKNELETAFGGPWPVCVADFNGDRNPDFAIGGNGQNEIRWYKNRSRGRLTHRIHMPEQSFPASIFIPDEIEAVPPLFIVLPYCNDDFAHSRLRDILIELSYETGVILFVPMAEVAGGPGYEAGVADLIRYSMEYAGLHFGTDPDRVYVIGMECNGYNSLRTSLEKIPGLKGIIPYNPLMPGDLAVDLSSFPDLPVCICSGTGHTDRSNHFEAARRISMRFSKAMVRDIPDVGIEVMTPSLIEDLLFCKQFVDTVSGTSYSFNPGFERRTDVLVFPNPSDGQFQISLSGQPGSKSVIQIRTLSGCLLFRKEMKNGARKIGVTSRDLKLMPGVYLIEIWTPDQLFRDKIIIL